MDTIHIHHPDDEPRELEAAPEWVQRACAARFEGTPTAVDPDKPDTYKNDPQNFWDGYREVRLFSAELQYLEFTDPYAWEVEVFDSTGQTVSRSPAR